MGLTDVFSCDVGIDLGTVNTLIYVKGKGIVVNEPTVVAVETGTNKIMAIGNEAKQMLGRTPKAIQAIRPMRDGVIADFDVMNRLIRDFIKKAIGRSTLVKPRVVVGVPTCITEVEKKAVRESIEQAGARDIHLIPESLAAAIGSNIPIDEPAGHMIVDIGGGTTEISVISLGGMVVTNAIRVAGDEIDQAIINYLKKKHNLVVGENTAEEIKIKVGSAFHGDEKLSFEIKGRDAIKGLPQTLLIDSDQIREAIKEPLYQIVEEIKKTLDQTPPELAGDIVDRGIVLAGGGSLLRGFDKLISEETKVPVFLAENPLTAIVMGTARFLESLDKNKIYKTI